MADKGLKILVCGGRDYADYAHVVEVLDGLTPAFIIHGAARGADRLAARYARARGVRCQAYPALWRPGGPTGPIDCRAGFDRNQQMLDDGDPDLVVAFPGGNGTADTVDRARQAGVEVIRA